ncbi:h15 domain-containing protein [Caerostris darwini]|uniref:H15 domain-containing protein n=1 Tax=Caerostris darwini TaxID=1538125 RepID=A0AAV4TID3_9ARAC|nr:h15 domain-containing protein [Caerostris darwini]
MKPSLTGQFSTSVCQLSKKLNRHTVLKAILHLQKLNNCSANSLKKYLASQYNVDCNTLDSTIKPVMKCAMDRNILSNLGHTAKISETKRRRKSSGGKKKGKKSSGGKKRKKSSGGKRRKSSGGKRKKRNPRKVLDQTKNDQKNYTQIRL